MNIHISYYIFFVMSTQKMQNYFRSMIKSNKLFYIQCELLKNDNYIRFLFKRNY